jgi:6-pyruvoyltetrahydropterin/6-carboxytetrahydropterin synthase
MSIAYLTRRSGFAAAHRYNRPDWSAEKNRRVFGACNNPVGHGHNYVLDVTVRAAIDGETGFSADLAALDAIIDRDVVAHLDHQHINHAVPEFADGRLIPTCENLAAWIWPRLSAALPAGTTLHRLRLSEDERLSVEYFGGGQAPGDNG